MKRLLYFLSMAAIAAMAAAGCTKYIPFYPGGGDTPENPTRPGGQGEQGVTLNECTNWGMKYIGRTNYAEDDGSVSRVEEFQFNYPGNAYFIVRSITDQDFKDWYNNDVKAFLEGEVSDVITTAKNNNVSFTEYAFTSAIKTIYFDMLIHGEYTTYMIEISKDGEMTGNYAKLRHVVEEEVAVENYLKWIGNWHVSDGYVGYDIVISACENNYLYYVDGWETGKAVQEQMNMDRDWIYARYRNADGNLYFYGQYLMSYEDEALGTYVDQMFVGTYLTSSSDANGVVDEEGADWNCDIAHTSVAENGKISIVPESFSFDNGYVATYHSMRYSRYCYDEKNWAHYNNSGVPSLPLVMEAMPSTKAVQTPARRMVSKESLRRVQLRQHVPKRERVFKAE
jgi:hypothetical protein